MTMPRCAARLFLAAMTIGSTVPVAADAPPAGASVIAVRAARLFDGRGDATIRDAVVLVEDGTISAVGSKLAIPDGAEVIDLGDATILPGLIDAHVHLSGEMGEHWAEETVAGLRRTLAEDAIRATVYAERTLRAGFTTVRNLGADEWIDVGLRNAIREGMAEGPTILAATYSLGARGGHCDSTGYPYERFGAESGIAEGIASGPDGFRDAVRFMVKYGADVIKVCATGGVLSLADEVDTPQVTQAEMDAIVDEAHRLRKRVAVHAHGSEGAKVAIRAGADSIEHGSFLDDEALRMMKKNGTWLVPTLMAGEYVSKRQMPPEIAAKAKAAVAARSDTLRRALALGVKIAFGTDTGVSPHGRNAEELKLMVDHGMTAAAALRAATSDAATLLGIEKRVGTLEVGKRADLIAVPGDALADVTAAERVRFVMFGGRVVRAE